MNLKIVALMAFIWLILSPTAIAITDSESYVSSLKSFVLSVIDEYMQSHPRSSANSSTVIIQGQQLDNAFIYNVRDFGAVGDGKTDDTAAIQAAIDAASIKSEYPIKATVYFPAGVYQTNGILINDSYPVIECQRNTVALQTGYDRANTNTVIRKTGTNGILFNITSGSLTMNYCTLIDSTDRTNIGLNMGPVGLSSGNHFTGNRFFYFDRAINVINMGDSEFIGNGFELNNRDILVAGTWSFTRFTSNVFYGWRTDSILLWDNSISKYVKFVGNSFEQQDAPKQAISSNDASNIVVDGVQFIGNDFWYSSGYSGFAITFYNNGQSPITNTIISENVFHNTTARLNNAKYTAISGNVFDNSRIGGDGLVLINTDTTAITGNVFNNAALTRIGDVNTRISGNPGKVDI